MEERTETGNGYGWRLKGTDGPLAGMSHGNSGFLMAYAALYECNHKAEYADKIQLLLRYEDFLYSEKPETGRIYERVQGKAS